MKTPGPSQVFSRDSGQGSDVCWIDGWKQFVLMPSKSRALSLKHVHWGPRVQVIVDYWVGFLNNWSLNFVHGCPCNWRLGRGSYLFPCLVRIGLIICNVNTGDVAIDFILSTMSKYMKSVLPINCCFKPDVPAQNEFKFECDKKRPCLSQMKDVCCTLWKVFQKYRICRKRFWVPGWNDGWTLDYLSQNALMIKDKILRIAGAKGSCRVAIRFLRGKFTGYEWKYGWYIWVWMCLKVKHEPCRERREAVRRGVVCFTVAQSPTWPGRNEILLIFLLMCAISI